MGKHKSPMSLSRRKKISKAMKGKKNALGTIHTQEFCDLMSEIRTYWWKTHKMVISKKTRAKMRKSQKLRREREQNEKEKTLLQVRLDPGT